MVTASPTLPDDQSHYGDWSRAIAAAVFLAALIVIVGWFADIPVAKSIYPHWATMKFNTALGMLFAAIALWCLSGSKSGSRTHRLGMTSAWVTVLIGGLTLVEYIPHTSLGIDQLFVTDPGGAGTPYPGRPAPVTAINFVVIGLALAWLDERTFGRWPSAVLAPIAGSLAIFAIAGYIYGIPALTGFNHYAQLAIHTALCFVLLSLGILFARPGREPVATLLSRGVGGTVVRRLLPMVVVGPFVLAWLVLRGGEAGWYDAAHGWVVIAVVLSLGLTAALLWHANHLNEIERLIQERVERDRNEEDMIRREDWFKGVLLRAPDGIVIADFKGTIISANPEAEHMFGFGRRQMLGHKFDELVPEESREVLHEKQAEYGLNFGPDQAATSLELRMRHSDGSEFAAEVHLNPLDLGDRQQMIAMVRDVTARREMEAELQRSNAELEQFAYVASHDLQEPLRSVVSFTQLLARRYQGKLGADADEYIAFAVDGANRMHGLIDDLLTYSRVGRASPELEPVDCRAALDVAIANLRIAIEESGAEVTADDLPTIQADQSQIEQLFQNLAGNAIKFRREVPPRVHVSAKRSRGQWQFSVKDNGIGIEPKNAERIFAAFKRLHTRNEFPGNGIGLTICRRIVERHGGQIWIEPAEDQGTTVLFTLPATSRRRYADDSPPADTNGAQTPAAVAA